MNESTIRSLVEAGAVKQMQIIADGPLFHVVVLTLAKDNVTVMTTKGTVKTWSKLDTAAKWIRSLGMGYAQIDLVNWRPDQKSMRLS